MGARQSTEPVRLTPQERELPALTEVNVPSGREGCEPIAAIAPAGTAQQYIGTEAGRIASLIPHAVGFERGWFRTTTAICHGGESDGLAFRQRPDGNGIDVRRHTRWLHAGPHRHGDRGPRWAAHLDWLWQRGLAEGEIVPLQSAGIANGAFGLLYLNPPYDDDAGEEKRTEHAFLRHCTRYLAEHGLLVFVVPRRRLAESARYLASHYARLRCWAFPDPEREAFDQVVVTGTRKAEVQCDQYSAVRLQECMEGNVEELTRQRYPVYNARATGGGEVLFATRTIDPAAAAAESRRSGLWVSTTVTDALWPAEDGRTRPLMPLRRGHLAMLVAAGFLDNLQLEADGSRILVKGRTSKEMLLVETTPEKEVYRERLRTTVVALDLDIGEITDIAA